MAVGIVPEPTGDGIEGQLSDTCHQGRQSKRPLAQPFT